MLVIFLWTVVLLWDNASGQRCLPPPTRKDKVEETGNDILGEEGHKPGNSASVPLNSCAWVSLGVTALQHLCLSVGLNNTHHKSWKKRFETFQRVCTIKIGVTVLSFK